MAMINCSKCGHTVSDKAKVCPNCGATIEDKKQNKKSIWIVGIIIAFVIGVIVGLFSHGLFFDTEKADKKVSVKEESNNKQEDIKPVSKENTKESSSQDQKDNSIKEFAMNEPMYIEHEYGDYTLTVDAVRRCDWLERSGEAQDGKVAILLELDIQNKTYEDPYNSIMYINNQIIVLDENNYSIQSWGTGYDDGEYSMSPNIPAGTNGKMVIPYIVDSTCNTITITFNNQYKVIAEITD